MRRTHQHRDIWLALGIALMGLAGGTPVVVWGVQQTSSGAHIRLWPDNPFIIAAVVVFLVAVYMLLALLLGRWLPGGFVGDEKPRAEPAQVPGAPSSPNPITALHWRDGDYWPAEAKAHNGPKRFVGPADPAIVPGVVANEYDEWIDTSQITTAEPKRIGIDASGGSLTFKGKTRIKNQDQSIRSKDTHISLEGETDID